MAAIEQADADKTARATPKENVFIDMPVDSASIADSQDPQELPPKPSQMKNRNVNTGGRLMGISSYQSPYSGEILRWVQVPRCQNYWLNWDSGSRSYNYEERYAPDPINDEIKENARVWKVYLDEADSYDDEMLRGFKDTIDSLLVFVSNGSYSKWQIH